MSPSPDPLAQVRSEGRRVVDSDLNQMKSNSASMTNSVSKANFKNVSSAREFDRQMNREALNHKGRVTPQGVRQVASRMHMAGYSEQSIMRGMRHHNREFSKMSSAQFRNYFNRNVKPALRHPKVQRGLAQNQAFKKQHGIPQNYRNMRGLKNINNHVQKQQRQQRQAREQKAQRHIAQNRKQGIQQTRSRGRR